MKEGNFTCFKCKFNQKEFSSKAIPAMVFNVISEEYIPAWIIMCPRCEEFIPLIGLKES